MLSKNIIVVLFLFIVELSISLKRIKPFYNLQHSERLFDQFLQKYGKGYASRNEQQIRLSYFKYNLKKINILNLMNKDAVFDINEFADLSKKEFESITGFLPEKTLLFNKSEGPTCAMIYDRDIDTKHASPSFDWRDLNKVTDVRNQKRCGSCWAYSVIGNIESQYAILKNTLIELSKQQLVDCTPINNGCGGGDTVNTFRTLISSGGVELETDYPYVARNQNCSFDPLKAKIRITACNNYVLLDEDKIKEVLFNVGPLAIALDADSLYTYSRGVVDYCPNRNINHAVLLVGYGTDGDKDYWVFKNSWGSRWGERGYFRVKRGINACGFVNHRIASAVL